MSKKDLLLAGFSGVLLALSFPGADLGALGWVCLLPLLAAAEGKDPRAGFRLGALAGAVFHIGLIYWITVSMTAYGGLPLVLSALLMVLFCIFLGLFTGIPIWAACFLQKKRGLGVCITLPFFWTAVEHLKSWLLTGFPWDLLGYSQSQHLSIIQFSDVTGVYGISFLLVFTNCAAFSLARGLSVKKIYWREPAVATLLLAVALGYGYSRLATPIETSGAPLKLSVIQPNIPQHMKWDPEYLETTMEKFSRLTLESFSGRPDLVLWPESATPFFFEEEASYRQVVSDLVGRGQAYLLLGSPSWEPFLGAQKFFNSAFLISPRDEIVGKYDKMHLVPYGEYVPLQQMFPFIQKMVAGIGDFSPGAEIRNLDLPGGSFATLICYEIIFPDLTRRAVNKGARFMVNITNDAWFGMTSAPRQHLAMAALRAVENRRFIARAANTGISAFIHPSGRITSQTKLFTEAILPDMIYGLEQKTFYTRYGDIFAVGCWIVSLALLALAARKKMTPTPTCLS